MKYTLTLFAFILAITLISCKKDDVVQKPPFADIEFAISSVRSPGDSTITEITYPNTIILKNNYTWSIDLGGAISDGTYSIMQSSTQQGDIKFTINQWSDFPTNPMVSAKLKSALQVVNRYGFPNQSTSFNFLVENCQCTYFPAITTNRK